MTPPTDDELLAQPGCIRAFWWSICRGCDRRIEVRDIVILAPVEGHLRWLCRDCGTH